MEDISAEIGYTATSLLVAWFGGGNLYVPATANPEHPIGRLIGEPAFRRLVAAWRGETLAIPEGHLEVIDRRNRLIAELIGQGKGAKEIADVLGVSQRRVQQLRLQIEASGLIPLILPNIRKNTAENAEVNAGLMFGKNATENAKRKPTP